MFRGWGFLLTEIWVLIAVAALVGLFIGWLVWGRRVAVVTGDSGEAERLRAELQACQTRARDCAQRVSRLESELGQARAAQAAPVARAAPAAEPEPDPEPESAPEPVAAAPEPEPAPAAEPASGEPAEETGTRPERLDAPRDGGADDLKRIKGIGPKLEQLCHRLGFYHFDQIANWTDAEIAWVDANLESFKGRVTRDNWVAQARAILAADEV